jgi:hypothetical protein
MLVGAGLNLAGARELTLVGARMNLAGAKELTLAWCQLETAAAAALCLGRLPAASSRQFVFQVPD